MKPSPLLRWAGGKSQLLEVLLAAVPREIDLKKNFYFEPFLGGGALFFGLHKRFSQDETKMWKNKRFHLGDLNDDLINFYKVVRDEPKKLIKSMNKYEDKKNEDDFYNIRDSSRQKSSHIERAAKLLYLNRLCFNGLYRVNSNGQFNVPYGKLDNPIICKPEAIIACSQWLKNSELKATSYEDLVSTARFGDLVYFDPPYIPISKTANFSSYLKEGFNLNDQHSLAQVISRLNNKGVNVILSNSDTALSNQIFSELNRYSVSVSRTISGSSLSRNRVNEIIATNIPIKKMTDPVKLKLLKVA